MTFRLLAIGVFWIVLLAPARGQDSDARAVEFYRQACEGGYAQGCYDLGLMYHEGTGVRQDYSRAVQLYRQACEGRYADGCHNFGSMYAYGTGVLQDDVRAHALFNFAYAQGGGSARRARDMVAERMTPQQIAEAQALARRCQEVGLEECL